MGSASEIPRSVSRTYPLVGRASAQAALLERLASAVANCGSLVLIAGTAGIGKTSLAASVARDASESGAHVLTGAAHEQTVTPPYGPWIELIETSRLLAVHSRAPVDILHTGHTLGTTSQVELFTQLHDLLAAVASERPLVVIMEDIHWADPASLDFLRFLGRRLAELPILVLATYRSDELTRDHHLYSLLPILVREAGATRIELRPLNSPEVRALVQSQFRLPAADEDRLVSYLEKHAEGNPFFVSEMLRSVVEEALLQPPDSPAELWSVGDLTQARLPTLLRQVLDARVDRLGSDARSILEIAAVIGQEVPLPLWHEISAIRAQELEDLADRAVAAHILEETSQRSGVRFAHALIREALYTELPPSRRRRWHRLAGETLASQMNPDLDAVAHHFLQTGEPQAVQWLIRAGERAQRLYAWRTAADYFTAALRLMNEHGFDGHDRGWLHYRTARLMRYTDPGQCIAGLDEAEKLALAAADQVLAAYALCDRGTARCLAGDLQRGLSELEAGVAALDSLAEKANVQIDDQVSLWVADTLPAVEGVRTATEHEGVNAGEGRRGALTIWLGWAGRFPEARDLGERLIAQMPSTLSLAERVAYGDGYLGTAIAFAGLGRPEESRRAFNAARILFVQAEHYIGVAHTGLIELLWAVVPYQADRPGERRRIAAEAVDAWNRASGAARGPFGAQLPNLLLEGQWTEARSLAIEVYETNKDRPAVELVALARHQGDTALIAQLAQKALPAGPETTPGGCPFLTGVELLRAKASFACVARDFEAASGWLEAHDRWLDWSRGIFNRAEGHLAWGAYFLAIGDTNSAHDHARSALECATNPRQSLALLSAHRLLGELDTAVGHYADAEAHLDESLTLADACAAPYERALTLLAFADLHGATGERATARALLEEARSICGPLEAAPALARAAALAARYSLGTKLEFRPVAPLGLTQRELEVLQLLSQRWTDREIAAALFVSPRTITTHVTAILNKFGVNSRREAAAAALQLGLLDPDLHLPTT